MSYLKEQLLSVLLTALIGLSAGLAAVAFQHSASWLFQSGIVALSGYSFWTFATVSPLLMTTGALLTGYLMTRFAPDAPGSGIPQVKTAYVNRNFDFSWKLILVKFFGGALSIGTGSSLGREGPTIHIGAALAGKITKQEPQEERSNALCAGAAAGLAAAFHTPIAGVTMVLEEIANGRRMDKYAARCLLASAISVSMVYFFSGDDVLLPTGEPITMKWEVLWISPVVAVFSGLIGLFFQWATLGLREWFKTAPIPPWIRPGVGAFFASVLCVLAFAMTSHLGAFGLGEVDLNDALRSEVLWSTAVWLLVSKVLATVFCYGAGGCGGIFAPLIFMGAMSGVVVHGVSSEWLQFDGQDQILLSLIGMTAMLGSVVRAPLTSILIVVEMTRQIYVLPALMVAAVAAVFLNRSFFFENFYNTSLSQDRRPVLPN